MASAEINRLMDHARIRLPGALDAALKMELFVVLDELFQGSNIWTEDVSFSVIGTTDSFVDNPDAYIYPIVPTNGLVFMLVAVADSMSNLQAASMPIPGQVVLASSSAANAVYTARVALTVTDPPDAEGYPVFPAWVMERYGSDILDGLLGRMMSQIAKPYSSPTMALFHLKKFAQCIKRAKNSAAHQNTYNVQSWRFPQTFASRGRKIT